ncbi:GNAT family N-acetyltransferase [Aliamphritea spongicola]|nr:GNAT family N-acetyltransferase [Aliamphritea spongicola]
MVSLLSPEVVENLPGYFHGINTPESAAEWFEKVLAEGRVLSVSYKHGDDLTGFIFLYGTEAQTVHIGYLLKQSEWGKGLASEMLDGLVRFAEQNTNWECLVAGVDPANVASARLLEKLNFIRQTAADDNPVFIITGLINQAAKQGV